MDGLYGSYYGSSTSQSSVPVNKDQVLKDGDVKNVTNVYEKAKPAIDVATTVLSSKFPKLKGLGPITTALDFVKDSYQYFNAEEISGKRYAYRAIAVGVALYDVPLAGPSFTVGEIMYDKLCSITSWINNAFTTQNLLDSDLFPH